MRSPSRPPRGTTLVELVVALAVLATLATVAGLRVAALLDATRVRGAANDVTAAFAAARELAMVRGRRAAVALDSAGATVAVVADGDSSHVRHLRALYGVTLRATRDSMAYSPTGLGYGAANLRVVLARGAAAETVLVSRLGRVRRP